MKRANHLAALLFAPALTFAGVAGAKPLTLALDVSDKNPLIESDTAAQAAAKHAAEEIAALELGSWVRIRHIGERNARNLKTEKLRVTRKTRAPAIARQVATYIAALPSKTPDGDRKTAISGFLELGSFECSENERIVIYTDAIETEAMSEKAFLSGKKLPLPQQAGFLKGCEVVFFGLGGHHPTKTVKSIRERWTEYFKVAGATFTAITE